MNETTILRSIPRSQTTTTEMRKGLKIDIFLSGIEYRLIEIHYAKFPIPDNDYGEPNMVPRRSLQKFRTLNVEA